MKITQQQFNKAQKTFSKKSLSLMEKNIMFSNIYLETGEVATGPVISPFNSYFSFFRHKTFVAVMILVFLISGTSYASAISLPGDFLYDMKVNIIEPIGLVLRFSEESKNEYKISLLQKRIEELNKLKERGYLDDNSQKASLEATNKNVIELENSAIFNEKGENIDFSEKIELYNNLIDVDLKVETNIEIIDNKEFDIKEDIIDNLDKNTNEPNIPLDIEINTKTESQNELPLNIEAEIKTPKL